MCRLLSVLPPPRLTLPTCRTPNVAELPSVSLPPARHRQAGTSDLGDGAGHLTGADHITPRPLNQHCWSSAGGPPEW